MGSGMFSRIGIGARLFIAFLGIAMLSLSSGVAGWWILRDAASTQSRLTAQALPAVAAAQQTVDATTRILAAGQNLAAREIMQIDRPDPYKSMVLFATHYFIEDDRKHFKEKSLPDNVEIDWIRVWK